MRQPLTRLSTFLLTIALVFPVLVAGCEGHVRYYDSYHSDYHTWDHHEVVYYNQWEHDTHRNHEDFNKRNDADKKDYYNWRHNQHDNH